MNINNVNRLTLAIGISVVAAVVWMGRYESESPPLSAAIPFANAEHGGQPSLAASGEPEPAWHLQQTRRQPMRELLRQPEPSQAGALLRQRATGRTAEEPENPEFEALKQTALADADPDERASAVRMLSNVTNESVIPILVQALADRDAEVRLDALHELAWSPEANELRASTLAPLVHDPSPDVRVEALRALGELDDPDAAVLIRNVLSDPNDDVRSQAESLLDDLG